MAAEESDQLVYSRKIGIATLSALTRVNVQALAESSQGIRLHEVEELPCFLAQLLAIAQRDGNTEVIEKVDERGLARELESILA